MLPDKHFIVAAAVMLPLAFFLKLDPIPSTLAAGLIGVSVDIDSMVLIYLNRSNKALKPYLSDLMRISREFDTFMDVMVEEGFVKILVVTHALFSAAVLAFCSSFFPQFLVPAAVGAGTHILLDLPILFKLIKAKKIKTGAA